MSYGISRRSSTTALGLAAAFALACAGGTPEGTATGSATPPGSAAQPEVSIACSTQPGSQPLSERASAFDSARISVGTAIAQVCYSRPAAKGRTVFGTLVPYDKLWRTGANEPTILHTPVAAEIAGIRVDPGSYSLYTIPGESQWTVIVNRSITQWGHEGTYTPAVQAQEVGRAQVPVQRMDSHVETFTIRAEPAAGGSDMLLEWERTRVAIPVRAVS